MDLDFNSSNTPKNAIASNVYADEMVIVKAIDTSLEETPWGEKFDISVTLEGQIEGLQFPTTYTVKGNFQKDNEGVITDWGGAFVVRDLIIATGYLENKDELVKKEVSSLLQKNKIPETFLSYIIGKKLWKASYVAGTKDNGKPKYKNFNKLCNTLDELKTAWATSIKNGYPKDYVAEASNSEDTSFKFGANVIHPNAKTFNAQP